MSLEQRGNRKCYYRVRRVNGRLVKEYVGSGKKAEEAAKRDADARHQAAEVAAKRRADLRALRKRLQELNDIIAPLNELADLYFEAAMYAAGYHKPKRGPWRKRRVKRDKPPPPESGTGSPPVTKTG